MCSVKRGSNFRLHCVKLVKERKTDLKFPTCYKTDNAQTPLHSQQTLRNIKWRLSLLLDVSKGIPNFVMLFMI